MSGRRAGIVFVAPVPLASTPQRPHEMARYLIHRCDADLLWVDPYPTRLPRLHDLYRPRAHDDGGDGPACERFRPRILPGEDLPVLEALAGVGAAWSASRVRAWCEGRPATALVVGRPHGLAERLVGESGWSLRVYDVMDRFDAFFEGRVAAAVAARHRRLLHAVDRVSCSSPVLCEDVAADGVSGELVHNAARTADFVGTRHGEGEDRVFGYVGTVGPWLDWDWIRRLADAFPETEIVLHGPVYRRPGGPLPPNVSLPGPVAFRRRAARMTGFAAGLIPFRRSRLTDAVDPIKYYEYRALGLPVLAAPTRTLLEGDYPGLAVVEPSETDDAWRSRLAEVLQGCERDRVQRPEASSCADPAALAHLDWRRRWQGSQVVSELVRALETAG